MKNTLLLLAVFLGITVFGQEESKKISPLKKDDSNNRSCVSRTTIYYIDGVLTRPLNIDEKYFITGLPVLQPTETNELPNGTMPLSKELPYVHTIRGFTFTSDYLRYTPRY